LVDAQSCRGRHDPSPWIGDGRIGYLRVGEGRLVQGRFRHVDPGSGMCSFFPDDPRRLAELRPGLSCLFLDGYWGERAELVLDENRPWQRREFEPSDAVRYPSRGGGSIVSKSLAESPPDGEIVKGGWDHEHCNICWETIGPHDHPAGYFSAPQTWICERCHSSYVVPRSLAFIPSEHGG
jgi:hypothetical protein